MYRPISDYAIVGDCHTAALISREGSVDWMCLPHFDSDAMFLRLLDEQKGGFCEVRPVGGGRPARTYDGDTAILRTTWDVNGGGKVIVRDFMPVEHSVDLEGLDPQDSEQDVITRHEMVRMVECVGSPVTVLIEVKPTSRWATEMPSFRRTAEDSVTAVGREDYLHAQLTSGRLDVIEDGRLRAELKLKPGQKVALVLTWCPVGDEPDHWDYEDTEEALRVTRQFWDEWVGALRYKGEFRNMVVRSALTLKLMTFEPTGAIVAAPTTSLPEQIGGVRNWDYRYTWIRDSAFTVTALMNLGYFGEARDYLRFFRRAIGGRSDYQVLYTIHGAHEARERLLDHLEGYRGSKPVRIGNRAVEQLQLDIYGELMGFVFTFVANRHSEVTPQRFREEYWPIVQNCANVIAGKWQEPDEGIWEMRSEPRHFVYSKAMSWLALDRAIQLAEYCRDGCDVSDWREQRGALQLEIFRKGFNAALGTFTQAYGTKEVDASILRLPLLGVVDADDPRMLGTVKQIEQQLMRNGLVYRYLSHDGLPGDEGAFLPCSFWLADNYTLTGRLDNAMEVLNRLLSLANDVGLLAEEADTESGEALGNFPQALTHIALINTVLRLEKARKSKGEEIRLAIDASLDRRVA